MNDGIAFKAQHQTASVEVGIRVKWDDTATEEQIIETLALIYAEASHRAVQALAKRRVRA